MLSWLIAALPVVAAGYWVSFAARLPESVADRVALGEVTTRWDFANWADVTSEPRHVMARLMHLAALHVPNATVQSVVWVNVVLVLLLLAALCDVLRRSLPSTRAVGPLAFFLFGLLVASPAFGSNWLHGERVGLLAVPMLFVTAVGWLQGRGRFAGRAILAFLIAGLAPWFHLHGVIVATALIPVMLAAATAAGSQRRMVWLGVLLLLGDVAAFFSMRSAGSLSVAGADWFGALASQPGQTALTLLEATGKAWLDLWPSTSLDERVLGGASWLLPLLLLGLGNRSPQARAAAAPWWSCILFGLLLLVVNAVRYELNPPAGTLREAMFGAFLLPIGLIGLLAARFGTALLAIGAGAMAVLAVQDWYQGIDALRVAHMRTQQVEAAMLAPTASDEIAALPVRTADELALLVERKWVPAIAKLTEADVLQQFAASASDGLGRVTGGADQTIHGIVRSSLRHPTAQWIAIVAKVGDAEPRIVAHAAPGFGNASRDVQWQIQLGEALAEGTRVRAVGLLVDDRKFVPLGAAFVVQSGKLVAVSGE